MSARPYDPDRPVEMADVIKQAREMIAEGEITPDQAEVVINQAAGYLEIEP